MSASIARCLVGRRRIAPLPRRLCCLGLLTLPIWVGACDKAPLLAPTGSSVVLTATNSVLPVNGITDIVATVLEVSGTPVQNGTLVTFSTTLGELDPLEARTSNGRVSVRFHAGERSGTAIVRAGSGGATSPAEGTGSLSIIIGGAGAERVVLTASTTQVPITGGTVALTANVTDAATNPLPGAPVAFTTSAGNFSVATAITDGQGNARTTLTTNQAATVTAAVGGKTSNQISITTLGQPTISITLPTTPITEGNPATITINTTVPTGTAVANVTVDWGDRSPVQSLGAPTGAISVTHIYSRSDLYVITATVRDTSNQTSSVSTSINIVDRLHLTVTLSASDTNPAQAQPVRFTATASQGGQSQAIVRATFDFGDGFGRTVDGPETTHVYELIGRKLVQVTVSIADGTTGQAVIEITVKAKAVTVPTQQP